MSALDDAISNVLDVCRPLCPIEINVSTTPLSASRRAWPVVLEENSLQNSFESALKVQLASAGILLSYQKIGEIIISNDYSAIGVWLDPDSESSDIALLLRTHILALILELNGALAFHGSAVAFNDQALVFLGPTGTGKSSTCALALARGAEFVSDDLVPLALGGEAVIALPNRSPLKLRFGTESDYLLSKLGPKKVVIERGKSWISLGSPNASEQPYRLGKILLLERDRDKIESVRPTIITGHDGVYRLMEHLFIPKIITALNLEPKRFELVTQIARRTPMYQVSLPEGIGEAEKGWGGIWG